MTSWQDITITTVIVVFSLSLLPQVLRGYRQKRALVSRATSLPTALGLYILVFTYLTLELYFAATMNFVIGGLWATLFIQSYLYTDKGDTTDPPKKGDH